MKLIRRKRSEFTLRQLADWGHEKSRRSGTILKPRFYDDELLSYLFYCLLRIRIHVIVNKQLVSDCF
jgi:hypothetical protein